MDNHNRMDKIYTNTSVSRYQACPRAYKLWHIDKVDPNQSQVGHTDSPNLTFGDLLHKCLEQIHMGNPDYGYILEPQMSHIPVQEDTHLTAKVRAVLDARKYCEKQGWVTQFKTHVATAGPIVENEWSIEFATEFLSDTYAGKIDRIVTLDQDLYVLDYKSRGVYPKREHFLHQQQLLMYCVLAKHNGYPVTGYIVDVWRIPKLGTKCTPSDYYERVYTHIVEITERQHKGTLRDKDVPYFGYFKYDVSQQDLVSTYNAVNSWVFRIAAEREYPKNTNSCFGKFGACVWVPVCQNNLDPATLNKREFGHPELTVLGR